MYQLPSVNVFIMYRCTNDKFKIIKKVLRDFEILQDRYYIFYFFNPFISSAWYMVNNYKTFLELLFC